MRGFYFWTWGISVWGRPPCGPPGQELSTSWWKESARRGDGECNYSSFASLGVRRRDPAYRSDSWTAARMVAPRDDFRSEKEKHHPVTCVRVGPVVGRVFRFTGVEHWLYNMENTHLKAQMYIVGSSDKRIRSIWGLKTSPVSVVRWHNFILLSL